VSANAIRRRLPKPLRIIRARPRLFVSLVLGVMVGLALPANLRPLTRGLIGWNVAMWLYLCAAMLMIVRSAKTDIHRRAALQDEGRHVILVLAVVASAMSFGAIIAQLSNLKDLPAGAKSLHIGLALITIIGSWLFVHMTYALHYAHEFFLAAKRDETGKWVGGISFPGVQCPDYFDFLYFSYVIGVACQTADVDITGSAARRVALGHGILAFFYNNAVLALSINIGAGFIGG
jgi:uncharacterized membrane protein